MSLQETLTERIFELIPTPQSSERVADWPEDEREYFRNGDWHSFTERNEALNRLRRQKVAQDVAEAVMQEMESPEKYPDPLATPYNPPPITLEDRSVLYPGDDRFAIRVRTVYGSLREQVVHADSLKDALTQALAIPLVEWLDPEQFSSPDEPEAHEGAEVTATEEEFPEMTPAEFKWAVHIERQAQIEKGYTAEHDDEKGATHLVNQAIDYARRGKPLKAAAIMVALSEHLLRTERIAQPVAAEGELEGWDDLEQAIAQELELGGDPGTVTAAVKEWAQRAGLLTPNTQTSADSGLFRPEVLARLNAIGRILTNEQSWNATVDRERKALEKK